MKIIKDNEMTQNRLVTIKKGDAVKVLKYKKAKPFLDNGWIIQ